MIDRVEIYQVAGSDRATIGAALRAGITDAAGKRFAGFHRWEMTWSYETHAESAQCTIVEATVSLTSTVTLPPWTPPQDVDSSLVRQWEQYRQALAGA